MRLLVMTSEPVTGEQVRDVVPKDLDPAEIEVMVVAPALQQSALKFWLSDADGAIARANEVSASSVDRLEREGIPAAGDSGESDPVKAIEDALLRFDADRIVLFTHPAEQQAYREDVDPAQLQERFGIPVDAATVGAEGQ